MEAAQSTVRKILNNESGNIIVVIGLIGMIAGALVYWTNLTGKVDTEVRSLGATQSTTYMRADFSTSIRKSLKGTNPDCGGLTATLESKFKNYLTDNANAVFTVNYQDNPSTAGNEVSDTALNPNVRCFFNPGRYNGLKWDSLKVTIKRTTEPNYMTLSNFIAADVLAVFRVSGKPTTLKYQLKYRLDVLTVNHFGTIFINAQAGPVVEVDTGAKLKMRSSVLFDVATRNATFSYPLSNLMLLPDTGKITYLKEAYTSVNKFSSDSQLIDFLAAQKLSDVFKKGIEYGQLSSATNFDAPYKDTSQWDELIDMGGITEDGGFPLPNTPTTSVIYNEMSNLPRYIYQGANVDTNEIYARMYPAIGAKSLTQTCKQVTDVTSGPYSLFVFNKLTQDLTIDFTQNIEPTYPPIFCGVMAVNNLIVKLNNQDETGLFYKHHILGKLIVRGKIKVIGIGELNIHDIMDFTESDIEYVPPEPIDITNLRTQFFNQKYYSTQNFFLPFFKPGQNLNVSAGALLTDANRFYVPRGTSVFFDHNCPSSPMPYRCRTNDIGSPTKEHLAETHWQKLMFEVFSVE